MKVQILQLSEAENELVKYAHETYGHIFENAHDLVFLTWNFLSDVKPDAWVFTLFLSQLQKSLTLSLLSTLRNHDVQFHLVLRYALESAVLAAYALHDANIDSFGYTDDKEVLHQNEKVKDKAYKWIEANYETYSEKIKHMKKTINQSFAHATIIATPQNIYFQNSKIGNLFFDKEDQLMTKQRLWWLANVSFGLLDFFSKVISRYPLVTLARDFPVKMRDLGIQNEKIKSELMNHPRFARWMTV